MLIEHASAIAINRHYRRNAMGVDDCAQRTRRDPAARSRIWFIVTTAIVFIDGLRTLAA